MMRRDVVTAASIPETAIRDLVLASITVKYTQVRSGCLVDLLCNLLCFQITIGNMLHVGPI